MSIWLDDLSPRAAGHRQPGELIDATSTSSASPPTRRSSRRRSAEGDALRRAARRPRRARGRPSTRPSALITTDDVRWACDVLRPVFDATGGVGRPGLDRGRPAARRTTPTDRRRGQRRCGGWSTGRTCSSRSRPPRRACPRSPRRSAAGISVNVTLIFSPGALPRGDGRLPRGLEQAGRPASTCPRSARWPRSSSPASTPRSTSGWTRSAPTEAKALRGKAGDRQRPARLRGLRAGLRRTGLERAEAAGAHAAAPAVGLHRRQGPGLRGHHVRRPSWSPPDTVNTMPEATLNAVADHGEISGDRRHRL